MNPEVKHKEGWGLTEIQSLLAGGVAGSRGGLEPGEGLGGSGCNEAFAVCPIGKEEPMKNCCGCVFDFKDGKTEAQREKGTCSSY